MLISREDDVYTLFCVLKQLKSTVYLHLPVRGHTGLETYHLGGIISLCFPHPINKNNPNNRDNQRITTVVYRALKHSPGTVLSVFNHQTVTYSAYLR